MTHSPIARTRLPMPFLLGSAALVLAACDPDPGADLGTSPAALADVGRPAVLVNPSASTHGTANTIQEGIAMVAEGGTVRVMPGTYPEALVIDKGLTLEAVAGASGPVVIAPAAGTNIVIHVTATEPVVMRGLSVVAPGPFGVFGDGPVDMTLEHSSVLGKDTPLGQGWLVVAAYQGADGRRATLVVRDNVIDGSITDRPAPPPAFPQLFGIRVHGDVDALIENNVIRRTGGACIFIVNRNDLAGELNAEIVGNDLDECHPTGRVASIIVGPLGNILPSPTLPVTSTGFVNIVGNTISNSVGSCLTSSAIVFETFAGRIEHNSIEGVVEPCATPTARNLPSAVWIGALRATAFFPPVAVTVRYNDISGNAHAGLRIAPNQTLSVDATCNFWGAADGPSGIGAGSGDAILVEPGGVAPTFVPFATTRIAASGSTSC